MTETILSKNRLACRLVAKLDKAPTALQEFSNLSEFDIYIDGIGRIDLSPRPPDKVRDGGATLLELGQHC